MTYIDIVSSTFKFFLMGWAAAHNPIFFIIYFYLKIQNYNKDKGHFFLVGPGPLTIFHFLGPSPDQKSMNFQHEQSKFIKNTTYKLICIIRMRIKNLNNNIKIYCVKFLY